LGAQRRRFEADFPTIDRWVDDFMARDLGSAADGELLAEARDVWFARVLHYIGYHTNATSLSMSALTQLESFLTKHLAMRRWRRRWPAGCPA
jgi:hypothetical protein